MRRFSKLKKRIESLFVQGLDMNVHCTVYHKPSYYGGNMELPRIWITLNKEVIFDFIKDFKDMRHPAPYRTEGRYIYSSEISNISDMIQEYIGTPANDLFDHVFEKDIFGLTDILKAADRRIGKKRLSLLFDRTQSNAARKVIKARGVDNEICIKCRYCDWSGERLVAAYNCRILKNEKSSERFVQPGDKCKVGEFDSRFSRFPKMN